MSDGFIKPDKVFIVAQELLSPEKITDFEKTEEGVSSNVLKIRTDKDVYYLRVSRDDDDSYAAEVLVHKRLKKHGVKVPEVVLFQDKNEKLGRSIFLTKEIPGTSLLTSQQKLTSKQKDDILIKAGQDIAKANSIPVQNYGRLHRNPSISKLIGRKNSLEKYIMWDIELGLQQLKQKKLITSKQIQKAKQLQQTYLQMFSDFQATLAHGDFCMDHIYHKNGEYSGIIDWGDVCGASIYHDLAYFYMISKGEGMSALLTGYQEVTDLPGDFWHFIQIESLFVALGNINWIIRFGEYKPTKHKAFLEGFCQGLEEVG